MPRGGHQRRFFVRRTQKEEHMFLMLYTCAVSGRLLCFTKNVRLEMPFRINRTSTTRDSRVLLLLFRPLCSKRIHNCFSCFSLRTIKKRLRTRHGIVWASTRLRNILFMNTVDFVFVSRGFPCLFTRVHDKAYAVLLRYFECSPAVLIRRRNCRVVNERRNRSTGE